MAKIVFYCHEKKSLLETFEYYQQDIDALRALGHQVIICTHYHEIPLNFDAMFIWWWTYAFWPVLLSRILGKPCLITGVYNFRFPAGFAGKDYFRRPGWQRWLIGQASRLATLNLFLNWQELEGCAGHFGLDTARYYPCAVHADYLNPPAAPREMTLFNLAWSGKGNLIRKGIPELLQAVRLLKDEGLAVQLDLAGPPGDGLNYLLQLIAQLNIGDQVRYLGRISRTEKLKRLRSCEVYVQPSHYEGFGLATAEAMGCGACVIVCDVGAVREVVGDCGLYVLPGSPPALAGTIKRALTDADLRHRLQQAARRRVDELFAFERKLERLKKYLSEAGIS